MKHLGSAVVGIVGILALTATSASAAIVCNAEGDCWHVKEKYDYRPEFGVHVYGDDWKWADVDHVSTRDAATGIRVFGSTSKTIRSGKGPATRWPFSLISPPSSAYQG
jgi:hypothetical protein